MKTFKLLHLALILVTGSVFTLISCENLGDESQHLVFPTQPRANIDELIYHPNETPMSRTYLQWINEWFKTFPCNSCDGAGSNHNGVFIVPDKSQRVYFLAGTTSVAGVRNIEILADKAILFPIVNIVKTFPCESQVQNVPDREETLEDFLKRGTAEYVNGTTSLGVTLDGVSYSLTDYHRFITPVFKTTNIRTLSNCFDACTVGDQPQDAVSDGYWIMLKGLAPGRHVLTFKGEIPKYRMISDVTYQIIVR